MSVTQVQIGITNRCNSDCYFCFRKKLTDMDKFKIIDIPLELVEKVINTESVRNIQFCGNTGETLFHPDIEKIIDMVVKRNLQFGMNTNGSRFSPDWWYNLGRSMKWEGDSKIIFALDGLKKEHEYYRNTKWASVFNNMKAFIEGGGKAVWQMILFKHNQHQITFIKGIAKRMGCGEVWIINSREYNTKYRRPTTEYNKTKTNIIEDKYNQQIIPKINCRFFKGKRVYIGVEGQVWPCCYLRCHHHPFLEKSNYYERLVMAEEEFINIKNNDLNYIVENSNFFKAVYERANVSSYNYDLDFDKQINYGCLLHCNESIDNKNRRYKKLEK